MTKRKLFQQVFLFILLSSLLWCICFWCMDYIKTLTHDVLQSNPNAKGWTSWIYELYPRLQTEKWRFNEIFFISKARQILIRISLSLEFILALYLFRLFLKAPLLSLSDKISRTTIHRKFTPIITILLYTCLALVIYNAIIEFKDLVFFSAFYKPVGIGKLLLPVFPSMTVLWLLYGLLIGSIIAVVILPAKWMTATVAAISFIYYQLILFGFGKYDHGYSTLTYALMIFPFFLWDTKETKGPLIPAWSLILIQWMICLAYFYCGLEKIFISGLGWFLNDNLQQHLLIHETYWGLQLASHPLLCKVLSFGVILLQLSFILLPFQKKIMYVLLPAGFIFHCASWLLLDAGGLFNPWWGVYLFFLFPLQFQERESNPISA